MLSMMGAFRIKASIMWRYGIWVPNETNCYERINDGFVSTTERKQRAY